MRDLSLPDAWERSFDQWLEPFLTAFGHKVRRKWAPVYVRLGDHPKAAKHDRLKTGQRS